MESKVKFENNSFDVISLFAALNVMIAHTCAYGLVLLFYFKLLFLLFKGSFIGKKNAEIIENEIAINFLL